MIRNSIFFRDNNAFEAYGFDHLWVVLFFIISGIFLIKWAKGLSEDKQNKVGNYFAYSLSLSVIVWIILKIYDHDFDIQSDLPFHMCNFIALLLPIFSKTRKFIYYEILLFWVLAGTSQAIITPDLNNTFPHYQFIKYWYVHAGLIVFMFYATFVYDMRPTSKSVFKSFIALQGYFLLMLIVNKIFSANYFYISQKPKSASLLDYFGDWPYYILVAEVILLPLFFLIYAPFHFTRKKVNL